MTEDSPVVEDPKPCGVGIAHTCAPIPEPVDEKYFKERLIRRILLITAIYSVFAVCFIIFFLLQERYQFFLVGGSLVFLFGTYLNRTAEPSSFGTHPLTEISFNLTAILTVQHHRRIFRWSL